MLLQVTNQCHELCRHCLIEAVPEGKFMSIEIAERACSLLHFFKCPILVISGGECFEHPKLLDICKVASREGFMFSLATNGFWLGDEKKEWMFEKITKLRGYAGTQLYANPKWYRNHKKVTEAYEAHKGKYNSMNLVLDNNDILAMTDRGRAVYCEEAMREVKKHPFHMSCLTSHLARTQLQDPRTFFHYLAKAGHFCTPSIDWDGNCRMSESSCCPSFCNLKDIKDPWDWWNAMGRSRPCYHCWLSKKFLAETQAKYRGARILLGSPTFEEATKGWSEEEKQEILNAIRKEEDGAPQS